MVSAKKNIFLAPIPRVEMYWIPRVGSAKTTGRPLRFSRPFLRTCTPSSTPCLCHTGPRTDGCRLSVGVSGGSFLATFCTRKLATFPPQDGILHYQGVDLFSPGGKKTPLCEWSCPVSLLEPQSVFAREIRSLLRGDPMHRET